MNTVKNLSSPFDTPSFAKASEGTQGERDPENIDWYILNHHIGALTVSRLAISLFLFLLCVACIPKQNTVSDLAVRKAQIPLFIEMPRNALAFDNIAPTLYQSLHQHFLRVGYVMVNNAANGYTLRLNIKRLEPVNKLVLPEIVLAHYTIALDVEITLLDFNNQTKAQKTFHLSSLISRPRNPILKSDFVEYEYTRLCNRSAPRIEHFFRPHLLKAFDETIDPKP